VKSGLMLKNRQVYSPQKEESVQSISASNVRLINADGEHVGIVTLQEAMHMAVDSGLTLHVVSPSDELPVCRIMDAGKYAYDRKKRQKNKNKTAPETKLIKFRLQISENDHATKLRQIERILSEGDNCKIMVIFRGREAIHCQKAFPFLDNIEKSLQGVARVTFSAKREGNNVIMSLTGK